MRTSLHSDSKTECRLLTSPPTHLACGTHGLEDQDLVHHMAIANPILECLLVHPGTGPLRSLCLLDVKLLVCPIIHERHQPAALCQVFEALGQSLLALELRNHHVEDHLGRAVVNRFVLKSMEAILCQVCTSIVDKNVGTTGNLGNDRVRLLWHVEEEVVSSSVSDLIEPTDHLPLTGQAVGKIADDEGGRRPLCSDSSRLTRGVEHRPCSAPNVIGHLLHLVGCKVRAADAPTVGVLLGQVPELDEVFCEALHDGRTDVQLRVAICYLGVVELCAEDYRKLWVTKVDKGAGGLTSTGFLGGEPQKHICR